MPILLLLFLTLVCLEDNWTTLDWLGSPPLSAALTWAAIAIWVAAARLLAGWVRRRLAADPAQRDTVAARYGAWRTYYTIGLFIIYSATLYGLGWGVFVQKLVGSGASLYPGSEVLILAPFLLGLILSWTFFYDADRALHATGPNREEPHWPRWAYLAFQMRTKLGLVAIAILLLIAQRAVSRLFTETGGEWSSYLAHFFGLAVSLGIFFCLPWILRLVLGLQPLPGSPMRDRLLAVAQRLNFRCSNILLWNTRRSVANATVAGVLPCLRYVVLTDRLIMELSPEEIEAVFGHEVGHVKHYHMPYYAGFLVVSIVVLWLTAALLLPDNPFVQKFAAFPFVAVIVGYIFLVFGFLSRRCERQADIYGCRAVSCGRPDCSGHHDGNVELGKGELCPTGIRTFIAALEDVARLNGINRDRPGFLQSWQHSTIARRVEFLQEMLCDVTLEPRFQRKVALVKWGLLLVLGATLAILLSV